MRCPAAPSASSRPSPSPCGRASSRCRSAARSSTPLNSELQRLAQGDGGLSRTPACWLRRPVRAGARPPRAARVSAQAAQPRRPLLHPRLAHQLVGQAQSVDVQVAADAIDMGGDAPTSDASLRFIDGDQRTLQLADGQGGVVRFEATALRPSALQAKRHRTCGRRWSPKQSLDVPFSPQAPARSTRRVELKDGENDLSQHLTGWLPTTERSSIWVTTNPYGETFKHPVAPDPLPVWLHGTDRLLESGRCCSQGLRSAPWTRSRRRRRRIPDVIRAASSGCSRCKRRAEASPTGLAAHGLQVGDGLACTSSWTPNSGSRGPRVCARRGDLLAGWLHQRQRTLRLAAQRQSLRTLCPGARGEGRKGQAKALLERTKAKRGYDLRGADAAQGGALSQR